MTHTLKSLLAAFFGIMIFAAPALAQQAKPAKEQADPEVIPLLIPIGILDVQAILRDASAVKNIRDQVSKYGSQFEKEIQKERDDLRKANQELARQRTILAPEAFAEKRRKFEQKVVEVQRLVQQRQRDLDKSRNEAMGTVNKAYVKIVTNLAAGRSLAIILRKNQVAYSAPTLNITKEILARLDKNLPTVKVAKPGK